MNESSRRWPSIVSAPRPTAVRSCSVRDARSHTAQNAWRARPTRTEPMHIISSAPNTPM